MQRLTDTEIQRADANPTAEEYRRIMKEIIPAFNHANDTDVDELTNADLPCADANPIVDEINTGFRNLILRINNSVDAPAIAINCIQVREVLNVVSGQKKYKSAGPSGLSMEAFINGEIRLFTDLSLFFTFCLRLMC